MIDKDYNPETVTIQDCIDMFEKKGTSVVIDNGRVVGWEKNKGTRYE